MAKYYSETIQKGSKGDSVSEWQKYLNSQGYNLTVDGDFGVNTDAATRDYQTKNGLTTDGIVGANTWGKAGYSSSPSSQDWKYDNFSYNDFTYNDYAESDTVKNAGTALNDHLANKPAEYQSQWQGQLDELMGKIMNREDFSYDFNGDALYQQYKDKYIQQGKMAMADTMGQAAAMTGGYGNSYAQSVGQQAYQASLDNLNDIIPELYQMALDNYNQEGQDLYNQYGMLSDRENLDYGRYRDSVSDYLTERDYLAGRYDSERDYDYSKYNNERNFAYGQYSDDRTLAYDEYATDKNLSYQEYRNAIADEQWQKQFDESVRQYNEQMALKNQEYEDSKAAKNKTPSGASYDNGSLTTEQIKALQEAVGANADGYWGANSTKAAGGLSADEAWEVYQSEINKVKGWDDYNEEKLQANQAEKGGSYYSTARSDVDEMISKGVSYNDLMNYAQEMVGNSLLTKSEYTTLVQYIRNKRESSSSNSSGGSRGKR